MSESTTQEIPDRLTFGGKVATRGSDVEAGGDTNDPTWLDHDGTHYVHCPGPTYNYVDAPDLTLTGNKLTVTFDLGPDGPYTPVGDSWNGCRRGTFKCCRDNGLRLHGHAQTSCSVSYWVH